MLAERGLQGQRHHGIGANSDFANSVWTFAEVVQQQSSPLTAAIGAPKLLVWVCSASPPPTDADAAPQRRPSRLRADQLLPSSVRHIVGSY